MPTNLGAPSRDSARLPHRAWLIIGAIVAGCAMLAPFASTTGSISLAGDSARSLALSLSPTDDTQFCATAAQQISAAPSQAGSDPMTLAPTMGANFAQLATVAPPEIRPDVQLLATTFQSAGDGSVDPSAAMTALNHYTDYLSKHCGITVPTGNAAGATPSTG
jgi:hypothetical protein